MNIHQQITEIIHGEDQRQATGLELIPSENYASMAVRRCMASSLCNKYSEGYAGARYYGGQEFADKIERLAMEKACHLFNCKYANVQPLSGAMANVGVYAGLLKPGDTVMGMSLNHGGHLTHGHKVSITGAVYNWIHYGVADISTGDIDYDEIEKMAMEHKPKLIVLGFSAYTRTLDYARFAAIAERVGAVTMMDAAHIAGLIAGKALKNPFDHGIDIITTTTHKTLRGPRGAVVLVREDEKLAKKVNKGVFPGVQGGPHMHQIAAKAQAFFEADTVEFQEYSAQVLRNAKAMEEAFHELGVPMVYGGTENHMLLIDTALAYGMSGGEAEKLLDRAGLTINKNSLPDDMRGPMDPSGIRFGTPAMTTRGMGKGEAKMVAQWMHEALSRSAEAGEIKVKVAEMCGKFSVPK